MTKAPATITDANLFFRETVRIVLMIIPLNDLKVKSADNFKAYVKVTVTENQEMHRIHCILAPLDLPRLLDETQDPFDLQGTLLLVFAALFGRHSVHSPQCRQHTTAPTSVFPAYAWVHCPRHVSWCKVVLDQIT